MPPDRRLQRRELGQHGGFGLGRQILVGEVDQRLLLGEQQPQPPSPAAIQIAERAVELAQRLPPLFRRLGGHQIADRLGLDQVHPPVEEGPPGELAGLGRPRAEPHQRVRHPGDYRPAGVQMQLGGILARIAARPRQPQHQRLVQHLARPAAQPPQRRMPRLGPAAAQRIEQQAARRPADPHECDRRSPRARGQCEDRVPAEHVLANHVLAVRAHPLAAVSGGSISRLTRPPSRRCAASTASTSSVEPTRYHTPSG